MKKMLWQEQALATFLFFVNLFNHFGNHFLATALPFFAVGEGVIEIFVARLAKDPTILELLGQRNNVKVKESNFALVPIEGRIGGCATRLERSVAFPVEHFVPFTVHVPVLHGMRHIGCLDKMLNDNCDESKEKWGFDGESPLKDCIFVSPLCSSV